MIQKTKKSVSILLSLLMVLSVFSGMAFTATAADSGTVGTASYTLSDDGILTIGEGVFTLGQFQGKFNTQEMRVSIKQVVFEIGSTLKTSAQNMFKNWTALEQVDMTNLATENVTTMHAMFNGCTALKTVTFGSFFDTSKVTVMSMLFSGCQSLTSIDFSGFDTTEVTTMASMFGNCSSLPLLDLSAFNTANVTNMSSMFSFCGKLATIYVGSDWNTDAVTSSATMFSLDYNLKGGLGTKYNSSYPKDKTYAHIDGGVSDPGYLTNSGHKHSFEYSLSEDNTTIIATCVAAGTCTLSETGDPSVSITITEPKTLTTFAPSNEPGTISILNKDNYRAPIEGVTAFNDATGLNIRDTWKENERQDNTHIYVQYYKLENNTETALGTEPPCREAGNYRAKITVENLTASVDYALISAEEVSFNEYRAAVAANVAALAAEEDSAEAAAIITNAVAAINAVTYDATKTLDENKSVVDDAADIADALAAQRAADALAAAKADAIAQLEASVNADDYREAEQADLAAVIETATAAINAAANAEELAAAVSDAQMAISAIKTDAELTAEEAAAAANQAAADEVIAKINAIGEVEYTDESKAKIDDARAAYDALTDDQKALVENYNTLTAAEARYAELKAAAEQPVDPTEPENPDEPEKDNTCKWCGEQHTGFWGRFVKYFHSILYFFAHLFGKR